MIKPKLVNRRIIGKSDITEVIDSDPEARICLTCKADICRGSCTRLKTELKKLKESKNDKK